MTIALFIMLLTVFSAVTGICTEGVKKILDSQNITYSSNILAFIIACIIGIGGTAVYYILNTIDFTIGNIICMILMGIAVSMGSMVGYDKVTQTIQQFKSK